MALVKYVGPSPSMFVPSEGKTCAKGSSIEVTNATATSLLSEGAATWEAGNAETLELPVSKTYPGSLPNLREFGSNIGDSVTDCTAAINAAIAATVKEGAAGPTGGAIWVPPGVYKHEGSPDLKERADIRFIGSGALVGGGGIGGGASSNTVGATAFIYTGAGARAWDFRSSLGCGLENIHCFAWGSGFTGPIWDLSGTEPKPASMAHFINSRAEATTAGGKPGKILHCIGVNLDYANLHTFDTCVVTGCLEGVQGVSAANHSSVGHRFNNCFFVANQVLHVANPQETWAFNNSVAESLFNDKGEILNSCRFIGYNLVMKSHGVTVQGCWAGSNVPAARAGTIIEARGENWVVTGNSLNTAEVGVYFPEGPIASIVSGNRFWKLNSGITVAGKTIDSILAFNRNNELIELLTDAIKERKGSIVQTANEAALLIS